MYKKLKAMINPDVKNLCYICLYNLCTFVSFLTLGLKTPAFSSERKKKI